MSLMIKHKTMTSFVQNIEMASTCTQYIRQE